MSWASRSQMRSNNAFGQTHFSASLRYASLHLRGWSTRTPEPMARLLACAALSFIPVLAAAQSTLTFESRVNSARAIEGQKNSREYVEQHLFRAMRTDMSSVMQRCLAFPGASKTDFTLVADIAADGSITNIDVKPATDTAQCFAKSFGTLRLSPLPEAYRSGLPIFIEMGLGG